MGSKDVGSLTHLFRAHNEARPVLLLGAGASYRSGVPLSSDAVRRIARDAYARNVLGVDPDFANPKPSDVKQYLEAQDWFINDPTRFAENFPRAVEHLLVPREFRHSFLERMVSPASPLGEGYKVLADFLLRGICNTVLTTNFDHLIARAMRDKESRHPHARVAEINRVPDDLVQFNVYGRLQVVYLHGSVELYTDKNLEDETQHLDTALVQLIRPIFAAPLIVIGYRGAEYSIMRDLLGSEAALKNAFRNGLYWCTIPNETIHDNVLELAHTLGSNFRFVNIAGFDEVMTEISEAIGDTVAVGGPRASVTTAGNAPDERILHVETVDSLDQTTAIATLTQYAQRLQRPRVTAANLCSTLIELGLAREIDGVVRPTLAAFLLFGREVNSRFPHACVAVTIASKQRRLFRGNLISQYHDLLEFLNSEETNPSLRVKTATSSEERRAYPPRALLELLVNMLVHRDYDKVQFSRINVTPAASIEFENPASIGDATVSMLGVASDGSFEPVRSVTEIRNPSLADIFYGLGPMDKAGSGLADVAALVRSSGGAARFALDRSGEFRTEVLQANQASPSSPVALSRSHFGVYSTNLLRFVVIPSTVSVIRNSQSDIDLRGQHLSGLPIFIASSRELWTFARPDPFVDLLSNGGKRNALQQSELSVNEAARERDARGRLLWLLMKHWEFYLRTFGKNGLQLDQTTRHRAFFTLVEGQRNTIIYDSALRRGVRRDVVKPRSEGRWHENEGINYQVVEYDHAWALQIKPFYMFTRKDGATPLLSSMRSARATRRMKFDRNKSVADDLAFWSRFLSKGAAAIDIGGPGVSDLVLSGAFQSFEVVEADAPAS